jgi:hypothetical protein
MSALLCQSAVFPDGNADAGTLSIQTRSTIQVTGNRIRAEIEYANNGTATARVAQAHLTVSDRRLSGPVSERLEPGQSASAIFELLFDGVPESRYPFIVYVNFNDENDYPFSALSCGTFSFLGEGPADIGCNGSEITLSEEGNVEFIVRNTGTRAVELSARLVLPREFSSARTLEVIDLKPGEAAPVRFQVRNFGALKGASYPVFCIVEYELDGRHGSTVGRSLIAVESGDNLFRRHRSITAAVLVLSGLLLAFVLVREKKWLNTAGKNRKAADRQDRS